MARQEQMDFGALLPPCGSQFKLQGLKLNGTTTTKKKRVKRFALKVHLQTGPQRAPHKHGSGSAYITYSESYF